MKSDERVLLLLLVLGGVAMISRKSVGEKVTQTVNTVKNAANTAVAVTFQNASENEKRFAPFIAAAEKKYGIPTGLLHRLIKAESSFRSDVINGTTISTAGAIGIAQIVPRWHPDVNPRDPLASIDYAGKYLDQIRRILASKGIVNDWKAIVAGYNAGQGSVINAFATMKQKGGTNFMTYLPRPEETVPYVNKIVV